MKAAQLVAPKRWEFTEVETPTAADGQVLVKMERVSVCGSDIRHTYGPVLDESEYPLAPCRGAHELAGVIVDSKTDEYHEGQRVIVIPFAGTGGLCEYVLSAPGRIAVLPEYGGLDEWVLCQPPGTVLYSCRQIGSPLQQNILIFGQGSIGLSFTMILSRMGARNVIVVDPLDYRLEKSKQMGSTHQINPDKQDVNEAVMEITKGHGPGRLRGGRRLSRLAKRVLPTCAPVRTGHSVRRANRPHGAHRAQPVDGQAAAHYTHHRRPQRRPHQPDSGHG